MTSFQKLLCIALSFLALPLSYYMLVFLPQREDLRFQREKNEREEKVRSLNYCIQSAEEDYLLTWDRSCTRLNLEESCSLPFAQAEHYDKILQDRKELCVKAFSK